MNEAKAQMASISGYGKIIKPDGREITFVLNGETDLSEEELKEKFPDVQIKEED